jgi:hypothetical protein
MTLPLVDSYKKLSKSFERGITVSYSSELEFATALLKALDYISDKCIEHEQEYPLTTAVVFHLLFGFSCPECDEQIGGIDEVLTELTELIQILQLEVCYESISGSDTEGD